MSDEKGPTADRAQFLLETLQECRGAWQEVDWRRSERDGQLYQLEQRWTEELKNLALAHRPQMSDGDYEELIQDLHKAWTTADPSVLDRWPEIVAPARHRLDELAPHVAEAVALEQQALRDAAPALKRLADQLQLWLQAVVNGDRHELDAWPQVLNAWRTGQSMPMREAAKVLQVSPAAIVQWEKGPAMGGRSPSQSRLIEVVGAMAATTIPPDTALQWHRRYLERMFGQPVPGWDGIIQSEAIGEADVNEHRHEEGADELTGRLVAAAESRSVRHLAVLVALAESPGVLDELLSLPETDPYARTRAALASVR